MQASIRYLRDHLSEILKAVQKGEEVNITSHNRSIAKIIPILDQENIGFDAADFVQELRDLQNSLKTKRLSSMTKTIIEMRKKERY